MIPRGKWLIRNEDLGAYLMAYCEHIAQGKVSGMMENYSKRMPVIVDNDFDFEPIAENSAHPSIMYEEWVILEQVKAYQETIKEVSELKDDRLLLCCVLEKPHGYSKKAYTHNGFHLHFPLIQTEAEDQKNIITPIVRTRLKELKTLDRMKYKDIKPEGWEKIIDPTLPNKTWLQYGSQKDKGSLPYKLTAIYDHNLQKISVEEAFNPEQLTFVREGILPMKFFKEKSAEYYLPIFLSILAWDNFVPMKSSIKTVARKPRVVKPPLPPPSLGKAEERSVNFNAIKELVEFFSFRRADAYDTWMSVGWALYSLTEGRAEGLELWIDFSKRSSKFKEGICEEAWGKMEVGPWTMGSLKYWARQDSPEQYKEWKKTEEESLLSKSLSLTNFDVANCIHKMFEGRFVCPNKKIWFEFRGHRWYRTPEGDDLYDKISKEVVDRFDTFSHAITSQISDPHTPEQVKDNLRLTLQKIPTLQIKLKDTAYKKKLMVELAVLFRDTTFLDRLDNNPYLLVWENGVLDLNLRIFRAGLPEDCCSKSTGINFPLHEEEIRGEIREVEQFLRKVFPSEGLLRYFKRWASSTLRGGNPDKSLPQWIGAGDNAKSATTELLAQMYGEYCVKMPANFLTEKSGHSSSCTPELERSQGARIGFLQEPEGKLNSSRAKEITGEKSVYSRGLYKEGRDIKMMMKWVMVCNNPIRLGGNDRATLGRLTVLPFLSTFTKDKSEIPSSEEEQFAKRVFLADPYFSDRLHRLAPAFAWMMWKEYSLFCEEGLLECEEIKEATDQYRSDVDIYRHFFRDKIIERKGHELTLTKLLKEFNFWYRQNFGMTTPDRTEVRDSFNRMLRKPLITERWMGLDIKPDEDIVLKDEL